MSDSKLYFDWKQHFRDCVDAFDFKPWHFDGEDLNLRAMSSKQAFSDWFAQDPGQVGNPYRDEGFYTREITNVSYTIQPKFIVEFGTSLGLGVLILQILNPDAHIVTVDNRLTQYIPGNIKVETGLLAKHNNVKAEYVHSPTSSFVPSKPVDLCFIDADHSYDAVLDDSVRAWTDRNRRRGAIIWHDYNNRHLGVMLAVNKFSRQVMKAPMILEDSSTVVMIWGIDK